MREVPHFFLKNLVFLAYFKKPLNSYIYTFVLFQVFVLKLPLKTLESDYNL